MSSVDLEQTAPRLSRRRVIAGAAWTAPVIVLTAAAPAIAESVGVPMLTIDPGDTRVVLGYDATANVYYFDLRFIGFSIVVAGPALDVASLQLAVTFTPDQPTGPRDLTMVVDQVGGWSGATAGGQAIVFTYLPAVPADSRVLFQEEPETEDGVEPLGASLPMDKQTGTFVLTASATGFVSSTVPFDTSPDPNPRQEQQAARTDPVR